MEHDSSNLSFKAKVWRYEGPAAWYFVTLSKTVATTISKQVRGHRRPGFGSVRVMVTVGNTTWPTSIFPDRASAGYLLPIKASVRKREDLDEGQVVKVCLRVVG